MRPGVALVAQAVETKVAKVAVVVQAVVQAVVVQAVADLEDAVVQAVADLEDLEVNMDMTDLVEQMSPEVQLKIVKVLPAQLPPRHLPLAL